MNGKPKAKRRAPRPKRRAANLIRAPSTFGPPSGSRRETGSLLLENAADTDGNVFECDLSPLSYADTRFAAILALYDRVRWNRLEVEFVPSLALTSAGRMSMVIDSDPSDQNDWSASNLMDNAGAKSAHITSGFRVSLLGPKKLLYTTPRTDQWRLSCPGTLYWATSATTTAKHDTVGVFRVHYDVELLVPSVSVGISMWENTDIGRLSVQVGNMNQITSPIVSVNVATLEQQTASGTPTNGTGSMLATARIDPSQAAQFRPTVGGAAVAYGARILWQLARGAIDDGADTYTEYNSTPYVGIVSHVLSSIPMTVNANLGERCYLKSAMKRKA